MILHATIPVMKMGRLAEKWRFPKLKLTSGGWLGGGNRAGVHAAGLQAEDGLHDEEEEHRDEEGAPRLAEEGIGGSVLFLEQAVVGIEQSGVELPGGQDLEEIGRAHV